MQLVTNSSTWNFIFWCLVCSCLAYIKIVVIWRNKLEHIIYQFLVLFLYIKKLIFSINIYSISINNYYKLLHLYNQLLQTTHVWYGPDLINSLNLLILSDFLLVSRFVNMVHIECIFLILTIAFSLLVYFLVNLFCSFATWLCLCV